MPAAYWCDDPGCTGIHGHRKADVCPTSLERNQEYLRQPEIRARRSAQRRTPEYRARARERRSPERDRDNRVRRFHGFTTYAEYEAYLATGCSVKGCEREARVIDHDHFIHAEENHSCDECRRGPLCIIHNARFIAIIDRLRAGGLQAELDYLGLSVTFTQLATEAA